MALARDEVDCGAGVPVNCGGAGTAEPVGDRDARLVVGGSVAPQRRDARPAGMPPLQITTWVRTSEKIRDADEF